MIFLWKNWAKKVTWSFFQIPLLGFNRKTYNIGRPIFFKNKLKLFQRLIAWLYCLDEFEKFAIEFFL